jgi:hypothetical protein
MPATMIPSSGPVDTGSEIAEPTIYSLLANQLPDDFVIIHSLKWLSVAAANIGSSRAPTGELDFLILHRELGILGIEVKGGRRIKYDKTSFVYQNSAVRFDPISQVRKSIHGLAHWLGHHEIYQKIGYAIAFPQADMRGKRIPPSSEDVSGRSRQNIYIDINDLPHLERRCTELMKFWKSALQNRPPGQAKVNRIVDLLCPQVDYTPTWTSRIEEDTQQWLNLTPQQSKYLQRLQETPRNVIEGRSGTGKTVLAIARARQLNDEGKKVLLITYNVKLAKEKLEPELENANVKVINFHRLCRHAARALERAYPKFGREYSEWCRTEGGGPLALRDAIKESFLSDYDALIMDETQVFAPPWLEYLTFAFANKPIVAFCDESQVFPFEEDNGQKSTAKEIADILHAEEPYRLTVNLRSPKAVFERIEEAFPATYQEFSPRPTDTDTLEEYVEINPDEKLIQILTELSEQGVSTDYVTILYTGYPPKTKQSIKELASTFTSIQKFRGLEAPVVVIYVQGHSDSTELACAYTRATSRCIVIYDWRNFFESRLQTSFTERMQNSEKPLEGLQEAYEYSQRHQKRK